jgi:hypothetical protein
MKGTFFGGCHWSLLNADLKIGNFENRESTGLKTGQYKLRTQERTASEGRPYKTKGAG